MICGQNNKNGDYRRRNIFELEREFDSPRFINVVKRRGHTNGLVAN
jgi:hypothetical protein